MRNLFTYFFTTCSTTIYRSFALSDCSSQPGTAGKSTTTTIISRKFRQHCFLSFIYVHMKAEEYWALCEAEYARVMEDYTLVSTTATTLDTRPANTYVYTATVNGTAFRFAQTVASYRGMVYTVTYTARPELFDAHMTDYERMLAAFDFRGN